MRLFWNKVERAYSVGYNSGKYWYNTYFTDETNPRIMYVQPGNSFIVRKDSINYL